MWPGDATSLPADDGVFDLALLSRVIHHLPDRRRCAGEFNRVLRPGGVTVIRTTVRERLDALVYEYWPGLRDVDAARFLALADIMAEFGAAGLEVLAVQSFAQPVQPSLHAYHDAIATRPQSKFAQRGDDELADGLARLRADADNAVESAEVSEHYDVLAFTKTP